MRWLTSFSDGLSGIDGDLKPLGLLVPGQQPLELVDPGPARDHPLEHLGEPRQVFNLVQDVIASKTTVFEKQAIGSLLAPMFCRDFVS
jgi:hypothetical protein